MRLALKIAYDGTYYHGYARQPGIVTIEGEIARKLEEMGAIKSGKDSYLQVASRTDGGVSAAGNVIAFDTDMDSNSIVNALVHALKEIWVVGFAEVPCDFNPRYAMGKKYRYYLYNDGLDVDAIKNAVGLFVGEHDFTNFARLDGRNPVRRIRKARVLPGRIMKMDFEGNSFLWNQVRRMAAAAEKAGRGEISAEDIGNALRVKCRKSFGTAPPENLLLVSVAYQESLDFHPVRKSEKFVSGTLKKLELRTTMASDIMTFL